MFTPQPTTFRRFATFMICLLLVLVTIGTQPIYAQTTPPDGGGDNDASSSFTPEEPAINTSNQPEEDAPGETPENSAGEEASDDNGEDEAEDDSTENEQDQPADDTPDSEDAQPDNPDEADDANEEVQESENQAGEGQADDETPSDDSLSEEGITEEEISEEEESDATTWNPTHVKYKEHERGSWQTIEETPHIPGKTSIGLCAYAYQAVLEGWGYARGTSGQTLTSARLSALRSSNPAYYATKAGQRTSRWIGSKVADCSGLIKAYLYEKEDGFSYSASTYSFVGSYNSDKFGIYSPYTVTGYIDEMPETPGIILHRTGHVGIYIGNGRLIEAKGVYYGVVLSEFNPDEWTSWAYVPCIDYVQNGIYTIAGEQVCIADGSVSVGWRSIAAGDESFAEGLYYFGSDGQPYTGIREIGDREYYFKSSGVCVGAIDSNGIVEKDGKRYVYTDDSPLTGWQTIRNMTYYFRADGSMVFGMPETIEGVAYLFREDGQVNTSPGYQVVNGVTYYCDANGRPQKGDVDGILYGDDYQPVSGPAYNFMGELFLYDNGQLVAPGFFCYQGAWYYVNLDGRLQREALHEGDRTYIFDEEGRLLSQFQNLTGSGIIYQ